MCKVRCSSSLRILHILKVLSPNFGVDRCGPRQLDHCLREQVVTERFHPDSGCSEAPPLWRPGGVGSPSASAAAGRRSGSNTGPLCASRHGRGATAPAAAQAPEQPPCFLEDEEEEIYISESMQEITDGDVQSNGTRHRGGDRANGVCCRPQPPRPSRSPTRTCVSSRASRPRSPPSSRGGLHPG